MDKLQKETEKNAIGERFGKMSAAVVTNYIGLDVNTMNELRTEFRNSNVEYKVVKNTLVKLAVAKDKYADKLSQYLCGPTAIAWSYDDPVAPAKVVVDFAKKHEKLKIKCAVVEGQVMDAEQVVGLSKMLGKKELQSKLLATFMAPAEGFVRLVSAAPVNFLYLLEAARREKESK